MIPWMPRCRKGTGNVVTHDVLRWLKLPDVVQSQVKANQAKRVVRANGKFVAGTEYGASR